MGASKDSMRLKWPIVLFVAVALFLYFVFIRQGATLGRKVRYGLMFDAGSTGSRVHVFSFDARTGRLLDEIFQEVKPGLSAYANDPEAAAKSLQPLMDTSIKAIPADQHATTPIAIKATAGLRQLGKEKSDEILQAVRDYWATFNFKMADDAVQIMEGSDEGVYAWITVNYLLNRLGSERKPTVSIMDLGGASTQIVFEPKGETMKAAPAEYVYKLQFGKFEYTLYQHSYDRYGLMRAREKILAKAVEGKHVCIPKGYTHKQKIESKDLTFLHHDTVSFDSCYATVKHIIDKSLCTHKPCSFGGAFQPDITDPVVFSDDMYAFSYFFDRTQLDGERPTITLGEIRDMAQESCARDGPDETHGAQCMDLTYIYALLHDGYNLKDSHKLNIAKKINGIETAWALGAMVVQLAQMDAQLTQKV